MPNYLNGDELNRRDDRSSGNYDDENVGLRPSLRRGWTKPKLRHNLKPVPGLTQTVVQKNEPGYLYMYSRNELRRHPNRTRHSRKSPCITAVPLPLKSRPDKVLYYIVLLPVAHLKPLNIVE